MPPTPKTADPPADTLEHPDPSSPLSEDATKVPDPEAPTDVLPPDGPHIQEIRGAPGAATKKPASSSSSSSD